MRPPSSYPRFPTLRRGDPRLYAISTLIGLVALTCICIIAGFVLAQQAPAWWRAIDRLDPTTERNANNLENDILGLASQIRPYSAPGASTSAPWEIIVSAEDANAWINTRLPKWIRNQTDAANWPAEITQIQVHFDDGQVFLGVQIKSGDSTQILCASVAPSFDHGALYAPARSIALGRLQVPKSWFLSSKPMTVAEERIPKPLRDLPQTRDIAAAFAGRSPVLRSPVLKLGDGRRVRLLGLSPQDGAIKITCCTELRPAQQ